VTLARDDRLPVALIVAVWLLSTAIWLRPGITRPDGAGYFAWLPSAIVDRDLVLFDEWARFGMLPGGFVQSESVTPNGHLADHWTVGSSVVWSPAFLLGNALPNGMLATNAACVAASAFFGLIALLAGYFAARRLFARDAALIATIAIWFGSPLLWYSEREALMAHAAGAAVCALIVLASMRGEWNAAALLSGLAFAIRPQNATFLAVPLLMGSRRWWTTALFFVVGASPQLVVNAVLYGNPIGPFNVLPSNAQRTWHAFERFWAWEPLLSWFHGVVPWTPLLLAGIIGLAFLLRADRRLGIAAIAMFAAQWLVNATADRFFWSGVSFGQRRFDNCTIVFLLGAAALFARLPRWLSIAIAAATSAWTMALFFAAQAVDLNRYVPPAELFDAFVRVPKRIGFLADVPHGFKTAVALIAIAVFVLYAAIAAVVRVRPVVAGTIACLVASAWLAYCGTHDAAVLQRWQPVIEKSRAASGAERDYRALLAVEADYLRRR